MPWVSKRHAVGRYNQAGGRLDSPRRTAAAVLGPCPPTAAVLAQILVRSPDFSVCLTYSGSHVMRLPSVRAMPRMASQSSVGSGRMKMTSSA